MASLRRLVREIHRRSMWQVLGIYVVTAWIAYEVILGLTEGGILEDWFPGVAVGLFIIGLPIVMATAFVQEGIGDHPDREESGVGAVGPADATQAAGTGPTASPPSREPAADRLERLFTWRKAIAAGVFVFVVTGLIALTAAVWTSDPGDATAPGDRSVAVLPLENLSPDPDDAYFAGGIHEEIITRLFRIEGVRTLARASVLPYADTDRDLARIAEALDVRYLLVGSVRRSGESSRVSVALVEPRTGEQLWANTYQASGTDVFAVQASIAENVAGALEAELTPGARARLAKLPTTDPEAYDDYLRARRLQSRSYGQEDLEAAIEHYREAVAADPAFALAHARLGHAHVQAYWFHYDHSEERLRRALDHIERALELDPELPEAHLAMGYYHYWARLAYDDALDELEIAEAGLPSDPEIAVGRGSIHRRAGRFEEAIENYARATRLDPHAWTGWWNLSETYFLAGQFDRAIDAANRSAKVGLSVGDPWTLKAMIRLYGYGRPRAALATLDSVPAGLVTGEYSASYVDVQAHTYLGDYSAALDAVRADERAESQFLVRPPTLLRGLVHRFAGDSARARAAFDSARAELAAELRRSPDDVRVRGALALALAGLGEAERAVRLAREAVEQLPPEREAWRGAIRLEELAAVQTMVGREDEAIESLERLLSRPSHMTRAMLRMDPTWAPLRKRPGFRRLLEAAS